MKLLISLLLCFFLCSCVPSETSKIKTGKQVKPPKGYVDMKGD